MHLNRVRNGVKNGGFSGIGSTKESFKPMRLLILTVAILFSYSAFGQYSVEFSQYMLNLNTINPAAAGGNDMMNIFGTFRSQYAVYEGTSSSFLEGMPISYVVGADIGFTIGKTKHGASAGFYDNRVGLFRHQNVNIGYAYRFPILNGHLSGGFQASFTTVSYDTKRLHEVESDYHSSGDPVIAQTEGNDFKMDLGVGFLFQNPDWFAGVSLLNILAPEYDLGKQTLYNKTRNLYFMGGYNVKFGNPLYRLKLSGEINTDFITWTGMANMLVDYKEKFWGGVGYRVDGAVTFQIGFKLFNALVLGYSYDLPTSKLVRTAGCHEVVLRYSFSIEKANKSQYKSIRFL